MSLRARIIALVALVLVACLGLASVVVGYQVRKELATELQAAMGGARRAAAATFEDLPRSDHPLRDLRQLVQTFDGNRHVRLTLVAAGGQPLAVSQPGETAATPGWFSRLIEERPPSAILPVPPGQDGALALALTPTPEPDVRAAWDEAVALVIVVLAVFGIGLILVWLAINLGLRPLRDLTERFVHVGAGDYGAQIVESGPPELRVLQRGFNDMTARLGSTMQRNRQLGEQLARLQDEERAEIARDLHDEVGPRLFAIGLDAAMIAQLCETGEQRAAIDRAHEIQHAVAYVQGQVRDLLGWLRPAHLTEFGLASAIDDLVTFWTARRADITFAVTIPEMTIAEPVAEVAYRIVQEAISNVVRHSEARAVMIDIAADPEDALSVRVVNDGFKAERHELSETRGLGLLGMRERVAALGGTLEYGAEPEGALWRVSARLPNRGARTPRVSIIGTSVDIAR